MFFQVTLWAKHIWSEIINDLQDLGILVTCAVWMVQQGCNTRQSALLKYQWLQTGC